MARAALALAFLMFSFVQPSLALPSGQPDNSTYRAQVIAFDAFDTDTANLGHPHENTAADASHDHAAPVDADDKSCEIHCAPLHAVPVECPSVVQPGDCGHAAAGNAVLRHGEYAEFVKPPRS